MSSVSPKRVSAQGSNQRKLPREGRGPKPADKEPGWKVVGKLACYGHKRKKQGEETKSTRPKVQGRGGTWRSSHEGKAL